MSLRILHLAYEDPRQPGAGGGALRTFEINRRLAANHHITAVVSGYAGAHQRVEDGVTYVPTTSRLGGKAGRLAYFASLPVIVGRFRPYDLVVEDFGAPFSTALSPLFVGTPVVASVQWLFAKEMARKYGLPFHWVEGAGLRYYNDFIVLSDWLRAQVARRRPDAYIETIASGIDDSILSVKPAAPRYLAFLGRLECLQKGCDLLPELMVRLRNTLGPRTPPLKIVGDGPDRERLEAGFVRRGVRELAEFTGWLTGTAKAETLAKAWALVMPSRFETFGIVAVEAQGCGAPVVAFDVGPLREVAGGGRAILVKPFDVEAMAAVVAELVTSTALFDRTRAAGRMWARRYAWDGLAVQQEQHYLHAVEAARRVRRGARS